MHLRLPAWTHGPFLRAVRLTITDHAISLLHARLCERRLQLHEHRRLRDHPVVRL